MDRYLSLFETPIKAAISSFLVGILGAFTVFVALFYFVFWPYYQGEIGVEKTRVTILSAELEAYRGKEFDVAAAGAKQKEAEEKLVTKEGELKKAIEEKEAALARLDADKDGVEIPADLCPNSDPKGGATAVNSKGCLAIEIAMSCDGVPFHPFDSEEKWVFSEGCELSDDPKMSYSCIADTSKGTWDLQGCDEFDPNQGG